MTEYGELFRALRLETQKKKVNLRKQAKETLAKFGVVFTPYNGGTHLIVERSGPNELIDFWPGTGLWIPRSTNAQQKSRGLVPLLEYIVEGRKENKDAPIQAEPIGKGG